MNKIKLVGTKIQFTNIDLCASTYSLMLLMCVFLFYLIRLEEKVTNLESENKVLRQQAVSMAPNKFLSGRSRSIMQVFFRLIFVLLQKYKLCCLTEVYGVCKWQRGDSGHLFADAKMHVVICFI